MEPGCRYIVEPSTTRASWPPLFGELRVREPCDVAKSKVPLPEKPVTTPAAAAWPLGTLVVMFTCAYCWATVADAASAPCWRGVAPPPLFDSDAATTTMITSTTTAPTPTSTRRRRRGRGVLAGATWSVSDS